MSKRKPVVVVLGANGQVGTEVCLLLKHFHSASLEVVAVCRGRVSGYNLERSGIEIRDGDVEKVTSCGSLLAGADAVVDFSLPRGLPSEFRSTSIRIFDAVSAILTPDARWIYASSIMALGMPDRGGYAFGARLIPRTIYGANKRFAEKAFVRSAKSRLIGWHVLRLGQVHGVLQSVSLATERRLREHDVTQVTVPAGFSYAVFCITIADAIAKILEGTVASGTCTMLPTPLVSWHELAGYYCARAGVDDAKITSQQPRVLSPLSFWRTLGGRIGEMLWHSWVGDFTRVGAAEVFSRIPALERRAAGHYYSRQVSRGAEMREMQVNLFGDSYVRAARDTKSVMINTGWERVRAADSAVERALSVWSSCE